MNKIMNIALVGNAPKEKHSMLNAMLNEEDLGDVCNIELYGADGQPELEALNDAINDWQDAILDGMVCLPMKQDINEVVKEQFPDESDQSLVLYVNEAGIMSSVKGNVKRETVAETLTQEDIINKVEQTAKGLKKERMILNPRIAVLAFNEEIKVDDTSLEMSVIAPAVSELVKKGVQAFGPMTVDSFFGGMDYMFYDAVVAMYDEQCLEQFERLREGETVALVSNINMPIAFAKPEGVLKATFVVIDAIRNRARYELPFKNPLQKLYHERREDGDKARFAVKKKGFNPAEHRRENVTFVTEKKTPVATQES